MSFSEGLQQRFEGLGMTSRRTRDRLGARLRQQGIDNQDVLKVMADLPRHIFVDEALAHRAYEDTALPIGFGQTLSQPYIVARMTEILLAEAPTLSRVLEIGTGSGFQTAVLSHFCETLYSVERIRPLQAKARQRLRDLKIRNVQLFHADGALGLDRQAPFDAILSAAAPATVPQSLVDQLATPGVLLIPVGEHRQSLQLIRKDETGKVQSQEVEGVHFVPLLSGVS